MFSFLAALLYLPHPAAVAWIAFQLGTLAIPLSTRFPGTQALCAFAVQSAEEYWGVKLTVVNPSAIKDGQAYVIGAPPPPRLSPDLNCSLLNWLLLYGSYSLAAPAAKLGRHAVLEAQQHRFPHHA